MLEHPAAWSTTEFLRRIVDVMKLSHGILQVNRMPLRRYIRNTCQQCGFVYLGERDRVRSGRSKFCSRDCRSAAYSGDKNPSWKGGISKNHYHYKKLQMERYPERIKARRKLHDAVRSGKIIRGICSACGDPNQKAHAHHEDYSKPLDVIWLCRTCHRKEHGGRH